jgi:hypothetical protein
VDKNITAAEGPLVRIKRRLAAINRAKIGGV